jgi:hypothetical protein
VRKYQNNTDLCLTVYEIHEPRSAILTEHRKFGFIWLGLGAVFQRSPFLFKIYISFCIKDTKSTTYEFVFGFSNLNRKDFKG